MNGTRWLRRLVLAHALLLCCCMARAQLKLGSNPATINKSSILELESSRQGLLLPRIPDTTVVTLTAAPDGTLIYFTPNNSLMIRKNGFWRRVADTVNFWQNAGAAGGDLTGTYPNPLIAPNAVTYAKFQQLSASNTLLGRYTAGAGNVQEITLGSGLSFSGNVLNASIAGTTAGGDLTGTYPNPTIASAAVTFAKFQNITGSRLTGRSSATAGPMQEIVLGTGLAFSGSTLNATAAGTAGGDLTGTYPNPTINTNAVTYSKFQQLSANNTLLGRYTTGAGNVQEITLGTGLSLSGSVLNASITGTTAGGDLTGTYPNPTIQTGAVTYGKIQNVTGSTLTGRYSATSGTMQEITLGTGLTFSGSVLNSVASGTAGGDLTGTYPNPSIAANAVTYSKIQPVTANTILGRYTTGSGSGIVQEISIGSGLSLNNSTGVLTASAAGTAGGDLTGTYPNPTIAPLAVTYGKMQNMTGSTLLGRPAAIAGSPQEITLGTGLSFSGTVLNATATGTAGGDLTGTYPNPTIQTSAVTYAKIQNVTGSTLLGRSSATAGVAQEITLGTGLSFSGTTLATSAWLQGGNAVASVQNFGTTSAQSLPFITNNVERMRLTSTGLLGIGNTNPSSSLHITTGTANSSGLRLENLINTSPVTASATPIGVDANGNVVRAPAPVYYNGTGASASVGNISKVWVAEVTNTATGIQTVTIPSNVAFATILNIQVSAKGVGSAGDLTTAPIATVSSNTLSSVTIRVLESHTITTLLLGSGEGLEPHTATTTTIYIRVEGN